MMTSHICRSFTDILTDWIPNSNAVYEFSWFYIFHLKDIPAGMELLTWYERVHLKRGRKRRKNPTPQPTGKQTFIIAYG